MLIDTSVWLVAAGQDHRRRPYTLIFLEAVALGTIDAFTDAWVLLEILHRFHARGRGKEGRRVYELACRIVPVVAPIDDAVLDRTHALLDTHPTLSVRDAVHAAVALERGATAICSYNERLDGIPGIERVTPSSPMSAPQA